MGIPGGEAVVLAALMILGVVSVRQLMVEELRASRARRKALKQLAKRLGGTFETISRRNICGERVRIQLHDRVFLVYFEVVMAADDPSSYTRVQISKPAPGQSFPSVTIVPEDFLERADNLLFGREDKVLGDSNLDQKVLVRSADQASLEAVRSKPVLHALEVFLDQGDWSEDFLIESLPDLLRVSKLGHLDRVSDLEEFVRASAAFLATFPTVSLAEGQFHS